MYLKPSSVSSIPKVITSYDDCVSAGNPVMESYPQRCSANGQIFTQNIGNALEKEDLIRLNYPVPNQVSTSPLEINGTARGTWFFEADFPIHLYDQQGKLLGTAIAQAQGEWMTEEFVEFSASLIFEQPATSNGYLVLEKNNPSDLEENSDELRIPVVFY